MSPQTRKPGLSYSRVADSKHQPNQSFDASRSRSSSVAAASHDAILTALNRPSVTAPSARIGEVTYCRTELPNLDRLRRVLLPTNQNKNSLYRYCRSELPNLDRLNRIMLRASKIKIPLDSYCRSELPNLDRLRRIVLPAAKKITTSETLPVNKPHVAQRNHIPKLKQLTPEFEAKLRQRRQAQMTRQTIRRQLKRALMGLLILCVPLGWWLWFNYFNASKPTKGEQSIKFPETQIQSELAPPTSR